MSEGSMTKTADSGSIIGWEGPPNPACKVKVYDFRRPDKFSRDQIRTVQNMHENFARYAETAFSGIARKPCSLYVCSIDQMTYAEYIQTMVFPASCLIGKMPPLKGQFFMDMSDSIKDLVLERSLGGAFDPTPSSPRELSHLEQKALLQTMIPVESALGNSWKFILKQCDLSFSSVECNPQFIQIVPPTEMIVLATLEFSCGGIEGLINLIYPYLTIEPIVDRLGAQYWYSSVKRGAEPNESQKALMYSIPIPVSLVCGAESLSIEALRALRPGSTVELPDGDETKATLRSGDAVIAQVKIGAGAKKGLRMLSAQAAPPHASGIEAPNAEGSLSAVVQKLESSVSALGSALGGSIARLTDEVRKLESGQEDLGDRILFSQADDSAIRAQAKGSSSLNAISGAQAELLSMILDKERNQLSALVLSVLDDALGARVLEGISDAKKADIVKRVGAMEYVQSELVQVLEEALVERMQGLDERAPRAGGIGKVVGILNKTTRATERTVLMALSESDNAFAEDIKRNMFVFEDIMLVDDSSLREIVRKTGMAEIVLALKGVAPQSAKMLLERFDALGMKEIRAELGSSGRARLADAEAAGMRVVDAVRKLEEEGLIYIEREAE